MRVKWSRLLDGSLSRKDSEDTQPQDKEEIKLKEPPKVFRLFSRKKHRQRTDADPTPSEADEDDRASISSVVSQPVSEVFHRDRTQSLFSSFRLSFTSSKKKPKRTPVSLLFHEKVQETSRYSSPDLRREKFGFSDSSVSVEDSGFQSLRQLPVDDPLKEENSQGGGRNVLDSLNQIELSKSSPCVKETAPNSLAQLPVDNSSSLNQLQNIRLKRDKHHPNVCQSTEAKRDTSDEFAFPKKLPSGEKSQPQLCKVKYLQPDLVYSLPKISEPDHQIELSDSLLDDPIKNGFRSEDITSSLHSSKHNEVYQDVKASKSVSFCRRSLSPEDVTCNDEALSKRKYPAHSAEDSDVFIANSQRYSEIVTASHSAVDNKAGYEVSTPACDIYCEQNCHCIGDCDALENDSHALKKLEFQEASCSYACVTTGDNILVSSVDEFSSYCDSVLDADFNESRIHSQMFPISPSLELGVEGSTGKEFKSSDACDSIDASDYCELNFASIWNCDLKNNASDTTDAEHLNMVLNEEDCIENESENSAVNCENSKVLNSKARDLQCKNVSNLFRTHTDHLPSKNVEEISILNKNLSVHIVKDIYKRSEISVSSEACSGMKVLPVEVLKNGNKYITKKYEVSDQSHVICGIGIEDICSTSVYLNFAKQGNNENYLDRLKYLCEQNVCKLYCNCHENKKTSVLNCDFNMHFGTLKESFSFESYFDRLITNENTLKLKLINCSSQMTFASVWNVLYDTYPDPDITAWDDFSNSVDSNFLNGSLSSEENFHISDAFDSENATDNLLSQKDSFPRCTTDREKNQIVEDEDRCPDAAMLRLSGQFVTLRGFDLHTGKDSNNDPSPCCSVADNRREFAVDISMLSNLDNVFHVPNSDAIIAEDFRVIYDSPICTDDVDVSFVDSESYLSPGCCLGWSGKCADGKHDPSEEHSFERSECSQNTCAPISGFYLPDEYREVCDQLSAHKYSVNTSKPNEECCAVEFCDETLTANGCVFPNESSGDIRCESSASSNEQNQDPISSCEKYTEAMYLGDIFAGEFLESCSKGKKEVGNHSNLSVSMIVKTQAKDESEENLSYNGVKDKIEMFENETFKPSPESKIAPSSSNVHGPKQSFIPSLNKRKKLSLSSQVNSQQAEDDYNTHTLRYVCPSDSQIVPTSAIYRERHSSANVSTFNSEFGCANINVPNAEIEYLSETAHLPLESASEPTNALKVSERSKSEEYLTSIKSGSKFFNRRHSSTAIGSGTINAQKAIVSPLSMPSITTTSIAKSVVQTPTAALDYESGPSLSTAAPPHQGQCGLQARCVSLPLVIGQVHGYRRSSPNKDASKIKSRIPRKQTGGRGGSTLKQPPVRPPLWLSKAELSQEIQRLGSLCEVRTKELNRLKMETKHVSVGFDAFAALFKYMVEDLNGLSVPVLSEDLKKTLKQLELAKQDLAYYEREVEELKAHHCQELNDLSNKLFEVFQGEVTELSTKHQEEMDYLKQDHQKQIESLSVTFDAASEENRAKQEAVVEKWQQELITQRDELQLFHEKELQDLEEKHAQSTKTLQEHGEQMQKKCAELKHHSMGMEDAMRKDTDTKLQWVTSRKGDLEKEVESLKAVLEMKNKELHTIRVQNLEMEKQLEELPLAREKIKMLQARAEDLEALMIEKTRLERTLSTENQHIKETFEKETKVNRRLSMENEELQWRLRQAEQSVISGSFSEVSEYPEEVENGTISPVKSPPQMGRSVFFTFVDKDCSSPRSQYKKILPGFSANYKISPAKSSSSVPSPRRAKSHSEPAEPSNNLTSTPRKVGKQPSVKQKKLKRSGSDCSGKSTAEQTASGTLSVMSGSMASSFGSECSAFEQRESLLEEHQEEILQSLEILREQQMAEENSSEGKATENVTLLENGDMSRSAEFSNPKTYYHMTFPVMKEGEAEDSSKVVSPENDSAQLTHSNVDSQVGDSGSSPTSMDTSAPTPLVDRQRSLLRHSHSQESVSETKDGQDRWRTI